MSESRPQPVSGQDDPTTDDQVRLLLAKLMGEESRGRLERSRRATFREIRARTIPPVLSAVLNRFKAFAQETREMIDERAYHLGAKIANEYHASVAWLFVKRQSGIEAIFAHKNRRRDEVLSFAENSMAGHVAQYGVPIAAPDVFDGTRVPAYKPFPGMKSAISVPLITRSREVLGVFQLESVELGQYRDEDLPKLRAAVAEFTPYLLMLRALEYDDDRWFPWRSFDLSNQLGTLCHDVRRAVDSTGAQCTIWTADRDRQFLHVHTTTGHASEYEESKRLPFTSFNGDLLEVPHGATASVRPREKTRVAIPTGSGIESREGHHAFVESWEGSFLNWTMSLGAPLYVRMPGESVAHAQGTLVLSCFDDEGEAALPPREELVAVAEEVGTFVTGYLELREELAVAYLDQALHACLRTEEAFEVIVRKFTEFFGLEAVAVDGYRKDDAAAEYLTRGGFGLAVEFVRSRSTGIPFQSLRPDVVDNRGNRMGTIHLMRSRPFTVSERNLANRLVTVCASSFEKWQAEEEQLANLCVIR